VCLEMLAKGTGQIRAQSDATWWVAVHTSPTTGVTMSPVKSPKINAPSRPLANIMSAMPTNDGLHNVARPSRSCRAMAVHHVGSEVRAPDPNGAARGSGWMPTAVTRMADTRSAPNRANKTTSAGARHASCSHASSTAEDSALPATCETSEKHGQRCG
jgi:hypothetical protein